MSQNLVGKTPDQKLVLEFNDKFDACVSLRQRFERQWYYNMAFYFGRQYVEWTRSITNSSGFQLSTPRTPAHRVRHISNKIRPIIRKEHTKLNRQNPQFWVVPSSPDDEDIAQARLADSVAEFLLFNNNFNRTRRQATWWALITGVGLIKTHYDDVAIDDYGYKGIIRHDCISPFHFWVPNIECPNVEDQPYVFHSVAMSPEDVKAKYGKDLDPDSDEAYAKMQNRYLTGLGINSKNREIAQVHVKETWIKPNSKFPDGAMFVCAGEELLYMQEALPIIDEEGNETPVESDSNLVGGSDPVSSFPYEHRRYPFTKIDHIPSGKFYSDSVIIDLIPLQKDYNRSRSQIMEARNLTSKPQWTVQKGSVDVKKLTSVPGLVIEYTPGFDRPQPINNPELPSYVMVSEERTLRDIDFNSNQFEVTQGRTPPGIEAASAIAYLQEENDSILGHTVSSLEEAVQDIGWKSLMLVKEKWTEERMISVVSNNAAFEAALFKNEDFPQTIDFRVETGSMAPRSKAAKQAFIMEMVKTGMLPQMEALKYLEMSETNKVWSDLQIDTRQAQRENFRLKNGDQTVKTNPFDNHVSHILTHERFLKSQEYERLPDEIKQLCLAHYGEHVQAYGQQTMDNLEQAPTAPEVE